LTGYSQGWQIGNIQGLKTVKHDGIVSGFTSMAIYLPEIDVYVATLSNCDCYRDIELPASQIAAIIANKAFPVHTAIIEEDELEAFQGRYSNGESEMIIALHDSLLMYYPPRGDKSELRPIGANSFQVRGSLDQLVFHSIESQGKYTLQTLNQSSEWKRNEKILGFKSLTLGEKELDEYVGMYQVPDRFALKVIRIANKLYGQMGDDKKEILCYEPDKFCARDLDAFLDFGRDSEGQVESLTFRQGAEIKAQKVK